MIYIETYLCRWRHFKAPPREQQRFGDELAKFAVWLKNGNVSSYVGRNLLLLSPVLWLILHLSYIFWFLDMEQDARSTENLVFAQSLSHDQLQNNREGMTAYRALNPRTRQYIVICLLHLLSLVLARRLQLRRPREELVNQGIMPGLSAIRFLHQFSYCIQDGNTLCDKHIT